MRPDQMNGRVTVLHLITCLDVGGAELLLARIVEHLDPERFRSVVISLRPPGPVADRFQRIGIPVYSLDMGRRFRDLRSPFRLFRLLRRYKPAIVHSHMFHANLLARLASPFAGHAHVICWRHTGWEPRWRGWANRFTTWLCDLTVTVSEDARDHEVRETRVSPERVVVVANGIETSTFTPWWLAGERRSLNRTEWQSRPGSQVWVMVARLAPEKDHPTLLRAFAKACRETPELELWLVGDGPEAGRLRELSSQLGLEDRVHWFGRRMDIPQILAAADIFVLSSHNEGMSTAILEAMAAGLPTVATEVAGSAEMIEEGRSGWIVPPVDPDALADRIVTVAGMPPEDLQRIGMRAREIVEEKFTIHTVVQRIERIFENLLDHTTR